MTLIQKTVKFRLKDIEQKGDATDVLGFYQRLNNLTESEYK